MDSVELVKILCKEKNIPISRLEKDCGFSNGYIRKLKEGKFPSDRLPIIAKYLDVSVSYLLNGENETNQNKVDDFPDFIYEINQNPDLKLLLEIGRKAPPDRLKTYVEFLNKITEEGGESEKGGE